MSAVCTGLLSYKGVEMNYISNLRKKIGHDPIFMPAASCCIVKDNKILLQKRTDNLKWAVHGGGLELGETFLEGLERELQEELNIKPINPKFIDIYSGEDLHFFYPNQDEVYVVVAIYLVKDYLGEINVDEKEVSEVKWFEFDKLPDEINPPDIRPINDIIKYCKNK